MSLFTARIGSTANNRHYFLLSFFLFLQDCSFLQRGQVPSDSTDSGLCFFFLFFTSTIFFNYIFAALQSHVSREVIYQNLSVSSVQRTAIVKISGIFHSRQ